MQKKNWLYDALSFGSVFQKEIFIMQNQKSVIRSTET